MITTQSAYDWRDKNRPGAVAATFEQYDGSVRVVELPVGRARIAVADNARGVRARGRPGSTAAACAAGEIDGVIGRSEAMRELFDAVRLVARTDATVLISGETGTGKELIARAIHDGSTRRAAAMVVVNCAALPRELVESELFGHERGAFTGAAERRSGRFERADRGTVFLDEIGELPLEAQAKLLRVLQEQTIERVGGNRSIEIDVRVIAASNRNLAQMVRAGSFRADLFYRLNVYPLTVPPLRERSGDVALLARHFLELHAARIGKRLRDIAPAALEQLERYRWPGNVRELENLVERMVIMAPERASVCELMEPLPNSSAPSQSAAGAAIAENGCSLNDVMRRHIARVLGHCGGTIEGRDGAAAILGLKPSTLRYKIKQLGIERLPTVQ